MEIIGILGFKGSGKDTAASELLDMGFQKFAFADAVKDLLSATFCWDRKLLQGDTQESREWREVVDSWWANELNIPNFTPRFALTHIGTDVFRKHFNDSIWILNTQRRIMLSGADKIVITDCRYHNEVKMVQNMGGHLLRITRGTEPDFWQYSSVEPLDDNYEGAQAVMRTKYSHIHSSEWAWNNITPDAIVNNNGSISEMKASIRNLRATWQQ